MSSRQSSRRLSAKGEKDGGEDGGGEGGTRSSRKSRGNEDAAPPAASTRRGSRGSPRGKEAGGGGKGERKSPPAATAEHGGRGRKRKVPLEQDSGKGLGAASASGDQKRVRLSVLSYKEGILEKLIALRNQKELELRKRTGKGAADSYGATHKNGLLEGNHGASLPPHHRSPAKGLTPLEVSHSKSNGGGGGEAATSPLGSPADDDDTPPLILADTIDEAPSPAATTSRPPPSKPPATTTTTTATVGSHAGWQQQGVATGGVATMGRPGETTTTLPPPIPRGPITSLPQQMGSAATATTTITTADGTKVVVPAMLAGTLPPGFNMANPATWALLQQQQQQQQQAAATGAPGTAPMYPGLMGAPGAPMVLPMLNPQQLGMVRDSLGKPTMSIGPLPPGATTAIDPTQLAAVRGGVPPAMPSPVKGGSSSSGVAMATGGVVARPPPPSPGGATTSRYPPGFEHQQKMGATLPQGGVATMPQYVASMAGVASSSMSNQGDKQRALQQPGAAPSLPTLQQQQQMAAIHQQQQMAAAQLLQQQQAKLSAAAAAGGGVMQQQQQQARGPIAPSARPTTTTTTGPVTTIPPPLPPMARPPNQAVGGVATSPVKHPMPPRPTGQAQPPPQQQQPQAAQLSSQQKVSAPPSAQPPSGATLQQQQQQKQQPPQPPATGAAEAGKPPVAPPPAAPPAPPPPPKKPRPPKPTTPFIHPFGKILGGLRRPPPPSSRKGGPGGAVTPPTAPIAITEDSSEAELTALLVRREKVLTTLRAKDLSSVVNRPGLLPAGRRKSQWDYLLDEMRWLATDYHEERKWKMAAAHVSARAAAGEAIRRASRANKSDQVTRRVSQRLAHGVVAFWRTVSNEVRFYSESEAAIQASVSEAASSSATPVVVEVADVAETTKRVTDCVVRSQELLKTELARMETQAGVNQQGPLLPHQQLAVRWLLQLGQMKCGAILADQEGMGKTVTTVAFLANTASALASPTTEQGNSTTTTPPPVHPPQLIIVPYWAVMRWRTELQVHAPTLTVALLEDWMAYTRLSRPRKKIDVVICSTSTLGSSIDVKHLTSQDWSSVVIDTREENVKVGPAATTTTEWSKVAPHCSSFLRSPRRLLLLDGGGGHMSSRTEYHAAWAVFLLPHLFPTPDHVLAWATKTVAAQQQQQPPITTPRDYISRVVSNFQLSRLVKNCRVIADVSQATIVPCPMTEAHAHEYRRVQMMVGGTGPTEDARKMLALRYACLHADMSFWFHRSTITPPAPPPPPSTTANGNPPPPSSTAVKVHSRLLTPAPTHPTEPHPIPWHSHMEDTSPMGLNHSLTSCTIKSGKLPRLQQLLTELLRTDPSRKVLVLAGLPHALSLLHTFLSAAEIAHEYALPHPTTVKRRSTTTTTKDDVEGPEVWVHAQLAISRFNLNPSTRLLLAHTWGCWGRGGLVPSSADVVVVVDDDWSEHGRRGMKELLGRMRMRRKALAVYRLVSAGTVENALWDEKAAVAASEGPASKLTAIFGATITDALPTMCNGSGTDNRPVEPFLWEQEKRLIESLLPPGLFRAVSPPSAPPVAMDGSSPPPPSSSAGADLCRDCFHRRTIGAYGKRLLRAAAGPGADVSKWSLSTLQRGSPVDMILGVEDLGGESSLLHEARGLLVHDFPATATNAQAWLEMTTSMRVAGIDIDPIVAGPPVPPIDGLTEVISHPSWMLDPADADLGLVIKYVQIVDTLQTQRRKKLESRNRPAHPHHHQHHHHHHHPADTGSTDTISSEAGGRGGVLQRPGAAALATVTKPKVEMPTDWTTEEDQELIRAFETYGKNRFIIPFVLSRKTPPHVRQRSSLHCMERIDMLTGQQQQGGAGGGAPPPRPARPAPLPPIRVNRVVQESRPLEVLWMPPPPPVARKAGRPEFAAPGTAGFLPGPDTDSTTRITSSATWFIKIQQRLTAQPTLPDMPPPTTMPGTTTSAGGGTLLGSITPTIPNATPLQLISSRTTTTAPIPGGPSVPPDGGGGGRHATPLSPLAPSHHQAWSQQHSPSMLNLAAINPSLVPAPSVVTAYQASLRTTQGMKGRKRDAPGTGGPGMFSSSSATLSSQLKMKAGGGGGGGNAANRRMPGVHNPGKGDMHGGGGGPVPMAVAVPPQQPVPPVEKHPTVTLPSHMMVPGGMVAGGGGFAAKAGGGGGGGGGVTPNPGMIPGGGVKKVGRPPGPGGAGGAPGQATGPANQVYMNQLMNIIQKRPELKTQITSILARTDLSDAQRIEQIGDILKAANMNTIGVDQQQQQQQQQQQGGGGGMGPPEGYGGGGGGGPPPPPPPPPASGGGVPVQQQQNAPPG